MNSEKTLEILGYNEIKENIKKHASSNLGKSLIDEMLPSEKPGVVLNKYNETKEAVDILKSGKGISFGGINDIKPYILKIEKENYLMPSELLKVNDFLRSIRNIKKSMKAYEFIAPVLYSYSINLSGFRSIEVLSNKRVDILTKFISNPNNAKHLQESFFTQKGDRYVIPIKASSKNLVKGSIVEASATKSTVFVEIDEIKDINLEIIMLKAQEDEECREILKGISEKIADNLSEIKDAIHIVGKYDFIFAKAKYSISIGGNEIDIRDDETIRLNKARHPILGKDAVPLDISIGEEYRTIIITGPNTGGKTITLKTVGLIVLMVQSGLLPPVGEGSHVSLFNRVLVDIGDSQSIEQSLSTFSGHMKSLVDIVNKSSRKTLVLIDEIGSGTDPKDGAALGIAILEELYNKGAITLSSTHYSKIKEYSELHEGFLNASMDFDRATLKPLYKLLIGIAGESNALWISKELGLSDKIIDRAANISNSNEILMNKKIEKFSVKKSRIEAFKVKDDNDENRVIYSKGDRIILNETGEDRLVYEHRVKDNIVVVFKNGEYTEVYDKRITLDMRAEVLYPLGYDLDQLFISFAKRKLEKDMKKGKFKNLEELNNRLD
ncbi:MAG: endonuclease MutS2 [Clostridia bacterium]|jgi:dsDNA-specific endonuclease/ATPase MutS2|nr:endonuclease MutS2 [Clostridia bacterium]